MINAYSADGYSKVLSDVITDLSKNRAYQVQNNFEFLKEQGFKRQVGFKKNKKKVLQ